MLPHCTRKIVIPSLKTRLSEREPGLNQMQQQQRNRNREVYRLSHPKQHTERTTHKTHH